MQILPTRGYFQWPLEITDLLGGRRSRAPCLLDVSPSSQSRRVCFSAWAASPGYGRPVHRATRLAAGHVVARAAERPPGVGDQPAARRAGERRAGEDGPGAGQAGQQRQLDRSSSAIRDHGPPAVHQRDEPALRDRPLHAPGQHHRREPRGGALRRPADSRDRPAPPRYAPERSAR